jgi:hypothetical protein
MRLNIFQKKCILCGKIVEKINTRGINEKSGWVDGFSGEAMHFSCMIKIAKIQEAKK